MVILLYYSYKDKVSMLRCSSLLTLSGALEIFHLVIFNTTDSCPLFCKAVCVTV
jgi:hypothetical protein